MSDSPETNQRLSELEYRVRMLERRLAARDVVGRESAPSDAPPSSIEPTPPMPTPAAQVVVPAPPWSVAPPTPPTRPDPPSPAPLPPRLAPIHPGPSAPRHVERSAFDVERTIGTRWFAAIGAVVVVIGVGLFVRLAYQHGWLNLIPPWGKCVSGAAFGAALLAVGEVIRRKFGALASAGLSAAGLGALFASAYAAHGIYALLPAPVAFASLAAIAALGFAISARGNLVSIGVLSLIAAYVNPLIIGDTTSGPLVLPAYLFAVLCAGLALSAWRAFPFRPLRALAWWGTLIYGTWWCGDIGLNHPAAALVFLGGVWAVVHAELAIASAHPAFAAPATNLSAELLWNRARFIATSFSSTAWAAAIGVNVLREGAHVADWWPPAVIAALAIALAIRLAGNLRILRDVPKTDLERLGAGLAMQAGALLIASVALAFSGWLEVVAWLALGVAAMGAGRWIRSRGLEVYGLVALSICAVRLISWDSPFLAVQPWTYDLGGIVVTRWAVLMAAGAFAWVLASRLIRPDAGPARFWRSLSISALIVALCHLNLGLIHPRADAGSVCVAWLVLGIAGLLLGRSMMAPPLTAYAVLVLIAASLRFIVGAPFFESTQGILWQGSGLVITRWSVLMLSGAVAWFIAAALTRETAPAAPTASPSLTNRAALVGIGLTMMFASFLHPAADAASVCYLWLCLAAIIGVTHSLARTAALDFFAATGLAAAAAAWVTAYPLHWMDRTALALHPGLVGSILLAATAIALGFWFRSPRNPSKPTFPKLPSLLTPGAATLLFVSTSLEVARIAGVLASDPTSRRAAVSIWWGLVAVGLIVAGFRRVMPRARHLGLTLMVIATAKAAIFDLAEVPQIWRVASFIGLGLLMLGIAVGYARISARMARPVMGGAGGEVK